MTTHRITLRCFARAAVAMSVVLLLCAGLAPDAHAQAFCTTPGVPPFPPPQPKPPKKPCAPYKCKNCSASPCFLASGVYTTSDLDLQVDTAGFTLMAARSYESNRSVDGPLGLGWMSSLTARLYYATYLFSAPSTYSYNAELMTMDGTILSFTGSSGGTFTAPFGSKDQLVRNADGTFDWYPEHQSSRVRFNTDGTIQRVVDQYNNSISYVYDTNGRLSRVQDDMGSARYFDVGWGADGRIATVTDNSGRVVRYEYDSDGTLIRVTNAAGHVTKLTYTPGRFAPLLDSIKDHWDRVVTQLEWFDDDRLESYTEGAYTGTNSRGERYSYQYFPAGLPSPYAIRSHSLGLTVHPYNASNWLVTKPGSTVDPATGAPMTETDGGSTTTYTYDALGRKTSMAKGGVYWKYTYDANFPNQVTSIIAYSNQAMTVVHPDWAGQHFTYAPPGATAAGALTEVQRVRTDGTTRDWVEKFTYDTRGRVLTHQDVSTYTTTLTYNAYGDLATVTTPAGTATLTYDTLGRVTSYTNEMGKVMSFTYDALNRPLTETLPLPSASSAPFTTTYTHDNYDSAKGFTYTHVTDPNGRTKKIGFDALANEVEEIDELNHVTSYNYKYNLLDNITDANGNVTRYVYDSTRTHVQTVHPDGGTENVANSGSVVTSKTDRRGITTTYTYDGFNRPILIKAVQNGQTLETRTHQYTGQKLMSVAYQKGTSTDTITFTYDNMFRVLTETQGTRAKITYGYTLANPSTRLHSYSVGPANGGPETASASYTYDSKARLRTIQWSKIPSGPFTISYNALDQQTEIAFPTGQKRLFTYDDQARIKTVTNTDSEGGTMVRYAYTWDYDWATLTNTMLGQVSHIDVTADANTGQPVGRTKYTYDAKYQLTRVDQPNSNYEAWTYDPIGNRLTRQATGSGTTNYTYYQNVSNGNSSRILSDGGSGNYLYDGNGNFIGRSAFNTPHVYDAQNRLTNVGDMVEAVYDAAGRRIKSSTDPAVEKTYVYMGEQIISETTAGWNLNFTYLMGPGLDEPLAVVLTDGSVHYFAVDGQGSTLGLIGAADDGYSHPMYYSPFGRELQSSAHDIPAYGYTGRERSPSTYWYYRFRHYDARLGRFTAEDPIQEFVPVIGAAQYSYVSNTPTMYTDPYGLAQCETKLKLLSSNVEHHWSIEWYLKKKWDLPIITPTPAGISSSGTVEHCLWVKAFTSTSWLIKKYAAVTTCTCPDSVKVVNFDSKKYLGKIVNLKKESTVTMGTITPLGYKPCKKPPL